ncbi:MAG: glycosyltransferase family 4 protein [Rubrobacter sp.]|nr:glycosyltransferase family 4 protein [Rubrobacter sp.]
MRIAFITVGDTSRLTGGYLYNARVFDGLGKYGIEVEEIVPSGASAAEQKGGIPNLATFDPRGFDAVVVDALARIVCSSFIKDWRRDLPVVAMVHELPSLAAPEGDVEKERGFEEALLGVDLFIAVSGHGKSVLENRGVLAKRIRVVSPGFDGLAPKTPERRIPPDAATDGGTARRAVSRVGSSSRWGGCSIGETFHRNVSTIEGAGRRRGSEAGVGTPADSGGLRALCVAQWIERKGVLDLVEAWRMVDAPNASLELVGETDADPEYHSRVMEAIGEDPSIIVSGKLDDGSLAVAYANSDFFVLPSRFEGYGIVYAEALSFGLPIVACDVGPVPELVGGEAGVFVSPRDEAGLSREIGNLLSDGGLRDRMSEAAIRRAGELPRWEDTARGFAEVLREAAEDG